MINIGKMNRLVVCRETESGFYLLDEESNSEVFLPPALASKTIELDQEIDVFVYVDAKDSIIATTKEPYATVGQYALLTSVNVEDFGAFFNLGIEKDLLVPNFEQKVDVKPNEDYVVRICLDEVTDRLYGTTKIADYIEDSVFTFKEGDLVNVQVAQETDLGFRVIIEKEFIGMIYHNEIYSQVLVGDFLKTTVKKIRNDGLVDLSIQKVGIKNLLDSKDKVLHFIKESGGSTTLTGKSSPDDIKRALGMSKKSFKSAIGMLYKDRKIVITDDELKLTK